LVLFFKKEQERKRRLFDVEPGFQGQGVAWQNAAMPDFRFLHAADLHLDSPLRGLEADLSAPAEMIRGATRRALGRMVDLALGEQVAFVIIAGDVYDGEWPDYGTGLFFASQMRRLSDAGIEVFIIRGNHDAANRVIKSLRMPSPLVRTFDHKAAHTYYIEALGVAVHGQSFADQAMPDDLSLKYPNARPGYFNIGVLHTSATGFAGHDTYAPCEPARLAARGYDYWALGHVHERMVLSTDPWILFPGNIQGRHIGETGAKGVSLVSVENGAISDVSHRVLDDLRWVHVAVPLDGAADAAEALARVGEYLADALREAGQRHLAARVTLTGATAAHAALAGDGLRAKIRNEAEALGQHHRLWIEKVVLRTRPAQNGPPLRDRPDNLGRLMRDIDALAASPPADLLSDWPVRLLGKLAGHGLADDHPLPRCAAADVADVLERARHLLEAALTEQGADAA
jgi:DNA repair exonuclease SbcCD nuclease subunit